MDFISTVSERRTRLASTRIGVGGRRRKGSKGFSEEIVGDAEALKQRELEYKGGRRFPPIA